MEHTKGPWKVMDRAILSDKLNAYGNWIIAECNRELTDEDTANLTLVAACPDLLEEHKAWAKITGRILVEALQGNFEYLKVVAMQSKIVYQDGEPYLKSEAIAKATKEE